MGNKLIDLESFFTDPEIDWRRGIRDSLNTDKARRWGDLELEATARFQAQVLTTLKGNPPLMNLRT